MEAKLYLKTGPWYKRIDWINASFLTSAHILAFAGTWFIIHTDRLHWQTVVLSLLMMVAAGIGITGGYHRLFAHKSYQGSKLMKILMLLFGASAFQNSALKWSSDHRRHHKYVDTEKDPYNIKEGFLFAHIGWVVMKYNDSIRYDDVPDLNDDPLVKAQDKYYVPLAIAMGFGFPTLIASFWGDWLGGFFLAGWLRIVLNEHFTFSINSFSHYYGTQPYSDEDTSRDNWFFALFTYGEGYHNFHHKFPFDYRNGVRAHQWDPTKWMIKFLSFIGLTKNLKKVPAGTILRARLKMDEKRMLRQLEKPVTHRSHITEELVKSARVKFEEAYTKWQSLKTEIANLKNQQMDALHKRREELRAELIMARQALQEAVRNWVDLCSGLGIQYHTRAFA